MRERKRPFIAEEKALLLAKNLNDAGIGLAFLMGQSGAPDDPLGRTKKTIKIVFFCEKA